MLYLFLCILICLDLINSDSTTQRRTELFHLIAQLFYQFICTAEVTFYAWEWLGEKEEPRRVSVQLKHKCQLQVNSTRGTKLRTVNLDFATTIDTWVSTNKRRTTLMIKVPKEYDLVSYKHTNAAVSE